MKLPVPINVKKVVGVSGSLDWAPEYQDLEIIDEYEGHFGMTLRVRMPKQVNAKRGELVLMFVLGCACASLVWILADLFNLGTFIECLQAGGPKN